VADVAGSEYDEPTMALDTVDAARDVQLVAIRNLGPSERVRLAAEMSEEVRRISVDGERRRHPELTQVEARWVVFRRLWGAELASRVPAPATRQG
jgi:hypothetical protein